MDLRKKYIECKERNEQQISNIQLLESRILDMQNKIKQKQSSVNQLKQTMREYKHLIKSHAEFQKSASYIFTQQTQTKPTLSLGRRDLTQLVATTPEKICKKIESLIEKQIEQKKVISEQDLAQIRNLIEHLPDKSDKQQFVELVESLKSKAEAIEIDTTKYKAENVKDSLSYQSVLDYLDDQNQRIKELTRRKDDLQIKTTIAEQQLIQRVRQLYKEPEMQSIIIKHMRTKAASHQVDVELSSTKAQVDKIHRQIQSIEDSTATLNMDKRISNSVKQLVTLQEKVQSMLATNKKFRKENTSKAATIDIDEGDLKAQLSIIQQYLDRPTLKPKEAEQIPDETLDIRNAISPKSFISTTRAISEIVNIIDSVNSLSRNSVVSLCADIREQLEELVNKWNDSLDKNQIQIFEDLAADHDRIDAIIRSVDALTTYVQDRELSYITEQKQKIESKLVVADKIEQEIEAAQNTLNQRHLIQDIGSDYIIQGKSFAQWLESLNLQ